MTLTSPRGLVMLTYLPQQFYATSTLMAAILQAQGAELDLLKTATDDVLNAAYLATAPDWSLPLWESEYGLIYNSALNSAQRKARIAPLLLGGVMPTPSVIETLLTALAVGAHTLSVDIPHYIVNVVVASHTDLPANWQTILAGLRAALPAHLDFVVNWGDCIWNYVDALNWTWDQVDSYNLTWNQRDVL